MPKLQEVEVVFGMEFKHKHDYKCKLTIAHAIDNILTLVTPKAKRLNIQSIGAWTANSSLYMHGNVEITHLVIGDGNCADIYPHIVKRNAATLNKLILHLPEHSIAQHLIFNEGDKVVVYPRLEKLELGCLLGGAGPPEQKVGKTIVPFPVLKQLCWKDYYPFVDDTLFRGNSSTLTYISMYISEEFIQIAQRYNVFYKGSHPRLQYIISMRHLDDSIYRYMDCQLYLQFTLDLVSPTAQALELDTLDSVQMLLRAIPEYPNMTNIQVLKMIQIKLTLSDIISLLKLLPILTYLGSCFGELGTEIDEIDYNSLPERLYSLHYPLHNYFNCWHVLFPVRNSKHFATAAILLAIICPKFIFIPMYNDSRNKYSGEMRDVLSTKPFSDYAEQVQYLFRD
ncbi:hypothetical protein BX070DRAFT_251259 [Coemansia spiralis]|nr:hypothetical protein BX070DRAFT_251259 [Coemansia spiralis]